MILLSTIFDQRLSLAPLVCLAGLLLIVTGCDFGAAKNAVQSVSPTVSLPTTKTTVSGRTVKASSGALLSTSTNLRVRGPDGDALTNMYGDPVSKLTLYGGTVSFSVRERPTPDDPVQFQMVATADGYQTTSEPVHLTTTGTKQFQLDMLSENPTQQPDGAFGTRDQSGRIGEDGVLQSTVSVKSPSSSDHGRVGLVLPAGTALRTDGQPAGGSLITDLVHYSVTTRTLETLPGNGEVASASSPQRFSVVGYLNQELRSAGGAPITDLRAPDGAQPTTWVRLPPNAVAPTRGAPLREGDQLDLFQFDPTTGTWQMDTTITVQSRPAGADVQATSRTRKSSSLGIQWPLRKSLQSRWWAWGRSSPRACAPNATLKIEPNGQYGSVEIRLQRSGLQYQRSVPVDAEGNNTARSLSTLLDQSSVPRHEDYTLSVHTRDGQSRTVTGIDPCGGTQSVSLHAPTDQRRRTDVLVKVVPTCPAKQHVRLASAPKVTVYYRELGTDRWSTIDGTRIRWVTDNPQSWTYIKRAEVTLDGLKQGRRYEFTTTYGQDQYGAPLQIPRRADATQKNGRTVVTYDRPLPNICS
ncbi:MAG: hypothetical protein BRD55_10760 [Bacteroidetes bacterium SW_9_63_38]|nr:MAG: hypothetical protein BRD55_10760 [Bacteroidetes bacterium SW_9_63_38]